jgi:LmbE family N-acetylglucosaminyl deacetylase
MGYRARGGHALAAPLLAALVLALALSPSLQEPIPPAPIQVLTVPQLLTYFLTPSIPQIPTGHFPLVVDIDGHLDRKLESIACYRSQFPPEKAHVHARVRASAEVIGAMAGCGAGELLASSRVPCTNDLLGLLFPAPAPAAVVTR